jgi:hypothetical protein
MAPRRIFALTIAMAALAGCGSSSSSARTVGDLCDRYASAVKAEVPHSLPPPVPADFRDRLESQAKSGCRKHAGELGYGSGTITKTQGSRLIGDLTARTLIHLDP